MGVAARVGVGWFLGCVGLLMLRTCLECFWVGVGWWVGFRLCFENFTVDASIFVATSY